MAGYREEDIKYETSNFWVLDVGAKGFEVYQKGSTHSTKVGAVGHGDAPQLGLTRAIAEADRRQVGLERRELIESVQRALKPHGWIKAEDAGGPPTLVATKTHATGLGPRSAEVWVGDRLRPGNLCVFAKYDSQQRNSLGDLWVPAASFRYAETVSALANLADNIVAQTYAASLSRTEDSPPLMSPQALSAAWSEIFGEQAGVMDVALTRERSAVER